MDRLSKIIDKLINQSPFIQEAIAEGLINISSLARKLNPDIQKILGKEVSDSAIIMAIKRMPPGANQKIELKIKNFMRELGDLIVRSNLIKYTFKNYVGISQDQAKFLSQIKDISDNFYTVSRGVSETTIITNAQFSEKIEKMFAKNVRTHEPISRQDFILWSLHHWPVQEDAEPLIFCLRKMIQDIDESSQFRIASWIQYLQTILSRKE